jgi:hypothetical protein
MNPRRFRKLPLWLASIYFLWSLLVYFGSLGSSGDAHSWWPLFLYPLIWPLGALHKYFESAFMDWLAPDRESAPESIYILNDGIAGGFYILVGTAWFWFIGRLISFAITKLFPRTKNNETLSTRK